MTDNRTNGTGNPKNLAEATMMTAAHLRRLIEDAVPASDGRRYEMYRTLIDPDHPSPDDSVNMLKCMQQLRILLPNYQSALFHSIDSVADAILLDRLSRCNDGQPSLTSEQAKRVAEAGSTNRKLELRRAFILQEFGEDDMADMLANNPDEYHRRVDEGRVQIDTLDQPNRDDEPMQKQETTPRKDRRPDDGMTIAAKIGDIIHGLEPDDIIRRRIEMLLATNDISDIDSRMKVAKLVRQINPTPTGLEAADAFVINAVDSSEVYQAARESDDDLKRIIRKIRKLEKEKYGLEDDQFFLLTDMPDDLKALNDQYDRRMRAIQAGIMRQYGEDRLADMYEDPVAYKAFFDERITRIRERMADMEDDPDTTEVDSSSQDEDSDDM